MLYCSGSGEMSSFLVVDSGNCCGSGDMVRPDKAGTSSKESRPTTNKAKSHVAWMASTRETKYLKPIDKAVRKKTITPPGQMESKFTTSFRISQYPRCRVSNQHDIQCLRLWRPTLPNFFLMNNVISGRTIFTPNNHVTPAAEPKRRRLAIILQVRPAKIVTHAAEPGRSGLRFGNPTCKYPRS